MGQKSNPSLEEMVNSRINDDDDGILFRFETVTWSVNGLSTTGPHWESFKRLWKQKQTLPGRRAPTRPN